MLPALPDRAARQLLRALLRLAAEPSAGLFHVCGHCRAAGANANSIAVELRSTGQLAQRAAGAAVESEQALAVIVGTDGADEVDEVDEVEDGENDCEGVKGKGGALWRLRAMAARALAAGQRAARDGARIRPRECKV